MTVMSLILQEVSIMKKFVIRIIMFALVTALWLGTVPAALASSSFQAVVTSSSMKVYSQSEPHDQIGTLKKGTVVTVKDHNGKAALISYNGYTGIARVSDMEPCQLCDDAESAEKAETASSSELADAKPMVTVKKTKVYKKASSHSDYVRVKSGVEVNLLSVSGSWAKVERGGVVGYMDPDALRSAASAQKESEPSVQRVDKTVMTRESCRVYAKPSSSADHVSVSKGVVMQLVATQGDWGMVKKDGRTGYIDLSHLTTDVKTAEVAADATPAASTSSVFSGSNEEIIFKFLTREMGYNAAAACGVLSNIHYESGYKPTCGGDGGTSYGICQWHLNRKTRMIDWCNSHGYDYSSLKGQLYYLQHELKTYYPAMHEKLKSVSNTAQGAYDAGYAFCYDFEAPSNRASRANTRGTYARDTLWGRYKA